MSEKTAMELVDELCGKLFMIIGGGWWLGYARNIKSAIEREQGQAVARFAKQCNETAQAELKLCELQKSAIVMRPISELPDMVPDGCWLCLVGPDYFYSGFIPGLPGAVSELATHFIIVPRPPKPARRLHPCYMPGCGGEAKIEKTFTGRQYAYCEQCGAHGPVCGTMQEAKDAWGYE